jgi:hypothetical protein
VIGKVDVMHSAGLIVSGMVAGAFFTLLLGRQVDQLKQQIEEIGRAVD